MKYFFALSLILLSGCQLLPKASLSEKDKTIQAANDQGFKSVALKTDTFLLTTYQKITKPGSPINIYIEGDGRSWITQNTISPNPTPVNPMALKLALIDNHANVVYLARPCQYTTHQDDEFCNPMVWTDERFSAKVISAMNQAVDQMKKLGAAKKVHLIGFSGGGGLAVLMAAHRKNKDIASIRTVAGDLDIVAMTAYHQATPTKNSLNPKDFAKVVRDIPQIHFVGDNDQVVPLSIAQGFLKAMNQNEILYIDNAGDNTHIKLKVLKNHTHQLGWTESWKTLVQEF